MTAVPSTLRQPLFTYLVIIPNILSMLYFGLIASPVYRSTSSIVVTNPKQSASTLTTLLSGVGGEGSSQGAYVLQEHIQSWTAFKAVERDLALAANYANGDFVGRFGGLWTGWRDNDTALWRYYRDMVDVKVDDKSGIVTLDADGYDPGFAHAVATRLLANAVAHMDRMTATAEGDHLRTALAQKARLEETLRRDGAAMAAFRARTGIYDPKERYTSDLTLANALQNKETELDAQRAAMAAATPGNPTAPALSSAIDTVRARSTRAGRSTRQMARDAAVYERLFVTRENDVALFNQASLAAQEASINATQNRYYLEIVSAPSQPITPDLPARAKWIGITLLVTLLLWSLLR